MNYIINPIWFYLMSVVDAIRTFSIIATIVLFSSCIVLRFMAFDAYGEDEKTYMRRSSTNFVWSAIFCTMAILVPSKETMAQIMIAKYATYENASAVIQTIQNAADNIIETVEKMK